MQAFLSDESFVGIATVMSHAFSVPGLLAGRVVKKGTGFIDIRQTEVQTAFGAK